MDLVALQFDQDDDGTIDRREFFFLVEYVVVTNKLNEPALPPGPATACMP